MDDAHLVIRSLGGDRRAYEALVRKYQNAAFGLALSYVRNAQDAEDLVQDAFIRGYLRLETLDDPARFGSWVKTIVVNGARQLFRRRRAVTARVMNLDGAVAELDRQALGEFRQRQVRKELWEEVEILPEIYRTPLILHYANRLSYEEIAGFLDLKVSTIRGRLQKGRQRMRAVFSEEMIMKEVNVVDKVNKAIYPVGREKIGAEIDPGDSGHLVLHMDVPTELKVTGHEGKEILIKGYKMAIGEDEDQAAEILGHIQLKHDAVDDWVEAGKHEGEQFDGTDRASAGEVVANIARSGGRRLRSFDEKPTGNGPGGMSIDLFPHIFPKRELLERMQNAVPKEAHRVSLVFDKVVDMAIPREKMDDRLREGFSSNSWSRDRAHGHTGKARVEVSVPAGMAVTLAGRTTGATCFSKLRGDVLIMGGRVKEVADVDGNLFLLNARVGRVERLGGNVLQFFHDRDENGRWNDDGKRARPEPRESRLIDVRGNIEIDLGHIDLSIENPEGDVSVRNRTGNTAISAQQWLEGKRWRVENRTGDIVLQLPEAIYRERLLSASTLSGEMDYSAIDREGLLQANSPDFMLFSTQRGYPDQKRELDYLNGDVLVQSEGGDIAFEVM